MIDLIFGFERLALWAVAVGTGLAITLTLSIVVERIALAIREAQLRRAERRYGPLIARALDGDQRAVRELAANPLRVRLRIARLMVGPLIADRDPRHIAATGAVVGALSLAPTVDRLLESRLWWRRTLALRSVGLLQAKNRIPAVVAALEDAHPEVRDAALDSLADMHDPVALPVIVVHLHNASLRRGRRAAAIAAYGSECEDLLLGLSSVDGEHRLNYARALAICGTERSRSTLGEWTRDARADVRAAAFEALSHVGLDALSASLAVEALESGDTDVRAMAAEALHHWNDDADAARHLGQHLDDTWPVAVRAARSLQSMPRSGTAQLRARADRPDLTGILARQMLWEIEIRR